MRAWVAPRESSPAQRGRGTARRAVEGAAAASTSVVSRGPVRERPDIEAAAAPSTILRMVPLPR